MMETGAGASSACSRELQPTNFDTAEALARISLRAAQFDPRVRLTPLGNAPMNGRSTTDKTPAVITDRPGFGIARARVPHLMNAL